MPPLKVHNRRRYPPPNSYFRYFLATTCSYVNPGEGVVIVLSSSTGGLNCIPILAIHIPDDPD